MPIASSGLVSPTSSVLVSPAITPAAPPAPGFNWSSLTQPLNAISGAALSVAGLGAQIGAGYASQAQAYLQQSGYAAQAQEQMRLAGLRADKEIEYANLNFKRKLFQTEVEQLNYKAKGNALLQDLHRTNAAARARAAANGVSLGSGSAMSVQEQNVARTYQDVGMVELSALVSRIFGLEDATAILKAGYDQAFYEREAAISNTASLLKGGQMVAQTGGLLSTAKMTTGALGFAKTFPAAFA